MASSVVEAIGVAEEPGDTMAIEQEATTREMMSKLSINRMMNYKTILMKIVTLLTH